jgi:hypothetical protein
MPSYRFFALAALAICTAVASAQDSTAVSTTAKGWRVSRLFGVGFEGGGFSWRRNNRLFAVAVTQQGVLNPAKFGASPMPDHHEFGSLGIQVGRIYDVEQRLSFRTGYGAAWTLRSLVTDSVVTKTYSYFSQTVYGPTTHHPTGQVDGHGLALTGTLGIDFNVWKFVWIGTEANILANQARIAGGVGLTVGIGTRGPRAPR